MFLLGTHIRRVENEFVKLWILDNILHVKYKPDIDINLAAAKDILDLRLRFQNGTTYSVICYFDGIIGFDKRASDYTSIYGLHRISAISFVGAHFFPKHIIFSFLRKYEFRIPTQLTPNKEEAIKFLTT